MRKLSLHKRTLALFAVLIPLLLLFIYVGLRSGPLAPVAVTLVSVEPRTITPALFGIGTVEARYTYKIGATATGRLLRLEVQVGDLVSRGQVLGELDFVDLDDRIRSQELTINRTAAALSEATARQTYATQQARRYETLFKARLISEEIVASKRQELQIANAVHASAIEELARSQSDRQVLLAQRANLRLIAPVDGMVTLREADPGTTIVAGQTVIEVIDPNSLWINTRFDQISALGLAQDLPAQIVLRSRGGQSLPGQIVRIEPKADAVTEELLAKVAFAAIAQPLPPIGELAEVTISLPARPSMLAIPNAAVRRAGDQVGVWQVVEGALQFSPITLGVYDLEGYVQVSEGLAQGDQVVLYSEKALSAHNRIHVVEHMPGVAQ